MTKKTLIKELISNVAGTCVCQKARETSRKITRIYDEALQPAGIKTTQFTMLAVISVQDNATLTELAKALGMDRTTLSRNMQPLERNGLVEVSAERYRRARSVSISHIGVAVMETALPMWRLAQDSMQKRLGKDTWTHFQADLTEVRNLL
jgi:DNA-binding MarR family transcriptional regulator